MYHNRQNSSLSTRFAQLYVAASFCKQSRHECNMGEMHLYEKWLQNAKVMTPSTPLPSAAADEPADAEAMKLLEPLASLLLSRQVPFAQAEAWLRAAYVRSSAKAYAAQGKAANVSALSVATGVRRREVKRLLETAEADAPSPAPRSTTVLPAALRLLWLTDPRFLDEQGQPRPLPRRAKANEAADSGLTFADLAAEVSKDIHPRTLLEELVRVGSAAVEGDHVVLKQRRASGEAATQAKWAVGCTNIGDHASAVLINLLSGLPLMFERAIFADGLTRSSAQRGTELARELWEPALPKLREKMQALVDLDADAQEAQDSPWRMRIGLFSYMAPMEQPAPPVKLTAYKTKQPPQRRARTARKENTR
jgi:Family of unknown function (DUF6502)